MQDVFAGVSSLACAVWFRSWLRNAEAVQFLLSFWNANSDFIPRYRQRPECWSAVSGGAVHRLAYEQAIVRASARAAAADQQPADVDGGLA